MANTKINTVIFIMAGTIVNFILAIFFIGVLFLLVGQLTPILHEKTANLFPFVVIAGIILSMIVYQRLTHFVVEKFRLEDKLDPLFFKSKKKKGGGQ